MAVYQLQRLRLLVHDAWAEVPVDRLTVFTLRLSGAGRAHLGAKRPSGYTGGWTISGLPVPPLDLAESAVVEVAIETTEGACWCGPGTPHPDGDRLALVVAGELHPC